MPLDSAPNPFRLLRSLMKRRVGRMEVAMINFPGCSAQGRTSGARPLASAVLKKGLCSEEEDAPKMPNSRPHNGSLSNWFSTTRGTAWKRRNR